MSTGAGLCNVKNAEIVEEIRCQDDCEQKTIHMYCVYMYMYINKHINVNKHIYVYYEQKSTYAILYIAICISLMIM